MRCLAKIFSLLPTAAVQSALKSAMESFSAQCQARILKNVAESAPAVWLGLSVFGFLRGGARRSSPRGVHGEAVLVTRLGGIICSDERMAPRLSAGPGQRSHTRAGYLEQVWEENLIYRAQAVICFGHN